MHQVTIEAPFSELHEETYDNINLLNEKRYQVDESSKELTEERWKCYKACYFSHAEAKQDKGPAEPSSQHHRSPQTQCECTTCEMVVFVSNAIAYCS